MIHLVLSNVMWYFIDRFIFITKSHDDVSYLSSFIYFLKRFYHSIFTEITRSANLSDLVHNQGTTQYNLRQCNWGIKFGKQLSK